MSHVADSSCYYCPSCETWSPADQWEHADDDAFAEWDSQHDVDAEFGYAPEVVVCPLCDAVHGQ